MTCQWDNRDRPVEEILAKLSQYAFNKPRIEGLIWFRNAGVSDLTCHFLTLEREQFKMWTARVRNTVTSKALKGRVLAFELEASGMLYLDRPIAMGTPERHFWISQIFFWSIYCYFYLHNGCSSNNPLFQKLFPIKGIINGAITLPTTQCTYIFCNQLYSSLITDLSARWRYRQFQSKQLHFL